MKFDSPAKGKKPDTGKSQGIKDMKIQNWKALRKLEQICDYQELGWGKEWAATTKDVVSFVDNKNVLELGSRDSCAGEGMI